MIEVFLASGNEHKRKEFQSFLREINIKTPADLNIAFNPLESGTTFFENAMIKAKALYKIVKKPILADDSGLCVSALHGEPGIKSARYAVEHANSPEQDKKNIEKLLTELRSINTNDRSAYFVSCIVLYLGPHRFFVAQEICEGIILEELKGKNGFGYDPVFFIPHLAKTMAELSLEEKNTYSHRAKSLQQIKKIISVLE